MSTYDVQHRVKLIELFYSNNKSIILTQRRYRTYFNVKKSPTANMIRNLIARFENTGSVADLPGRGPCRTVHNDAAVQCVQQSVLQDPYASTRRRSSQVGISRTSLQKILHLDLKLFPYKIQMVQSLKTQDTHQRLQYAIQFQKMAKDDNQFLNNLIMSDEAHFCLNGCINKQNNRFWGKSNPRELHHHQLHPQKCTVWCGVMADRVIGPYFFENEEGHAEKITGARYRTMIEMFLRPAIQDNQQIWFQQDGATAHTAKATMKILREIFGKRIISKNSAFNWPPRSPDLTAPDFFLWGYLKDRVYINKPKIIHDLKDNIQVEIRKLRPEILRTTMESALKRACICEQQNGCHLTDVVFHT